MNVLMMRGMLARRARELPMCAARVPSDYWKKSWRPKQAFIRTRPWTAAVDEDAVEKLLILETNAGLYTCCQQPPGPGLSVIEAECAGVSCVLSPSVRNAREGAAARERGERSAG